MLGIEIGANLNAQGFADGMKNIERGLSSFGKSFAGQFLGAEALKSITSKVYGAFQDAINDVREIKIGSLITGLNAQEFQQVRASLEASGTSAESLAKVFLNMAEAIQKVKDGGEEGAKMQASLARLGISLDDIGKKSRQAITFELFDGLREAAKQSKLTEEQLTSLADVIGKREVNQMLPFIARGTDNLADITNIKSPEDLKTLGALKERVTANKSNWKAGLEKLAVWGGAIAVNLSDMGDAMKVAALKMTGDKNAKLRSEISNEIAAKQALLDKINADLARRRTNQARDATLKAVEDAKDQANREKIAQIEAERDEFRNKTKSPEQRLAEIRKEQAEVAARLADPNLGPKYQGNRDMARQFKEERAILERRQAELQSEAFGLEKRQTSAPFHQQVNQLQHIGAAISGISSPQAISREHIQELKRHTGHMAQMNMKMNKLTSIDNALRTQGDAYA